jgi:hypothetical protein
MTQQKRELINHLQMPSVLRLGLPTSFLKHPTASQPQKRSAFADARQIVQHTRHHTVAICIIIC